MSLNPTKIEWTDRTWNPVTGCYGPGGNKNSPNWCPYCYARRMATRFAGTPAFPKGFEPTFHPDRLVEPYKLKKPSKIFTCSMADLFGSWVPENWIGEILAAIANNPSHIFQVLTKNAENLARWGKHFPKNLWLGVSVACQKDAARITYLKIADVSVHFVSFEPLLGPVETDLQGLGWIIIGAQTRPTCLPKPEWIGPIISAARADGIPVFLKNNLRWPEKLQEFPDSKGEEVSRASNR